MKNVNLRRAMGAALATLAIGLVTASCASEQQQQSPPGWTTVTSGQCLARGTACFQNSDCCTLWCANGYCSRKEP